MSCWNALLKGSRGWFVKKLWNYANCFWWIMCLIWPVKYRLEVKWFWVELHEICFCSISIFPATGICENCLIFMFSVWNQDNNVFGLGLLLVHTRFSTYLFCSIFRSSLVVHIHSTSFQIEYWNVLKTKCVHVTWLYLRKNYLYCMCTEIKT